MSCVNNDKAKEKIERHSDFQMYVHSPMSAYMEKIYAENSVLKKKIEAGESDLGTFPEYFLEIYELQMTDFQDRDLFFIEQANLFVEKQKRIYQEDDVIARFNSMVNSCIACHQVKCTGPIARIKKLKINTTN